ncbi:hypothetical protein JCM19314_704 [Nonlabens ulvanivorans]|uniref:Uncharacterized protein n=1 Tax=Nonlabens ulvanivorans TaxID=906888 RepID=A0A090QDS4_NONUL|nr:hypothetical protein JCM19314_704 [Nonlabens ulvanivorans]
MSLSKTTILFGVFALHTTYYILIKVVNIPDYVPDKPLLKSDLSVSQKA